MAASAVILNPAGLSGRAEALPNGVSLAGGPMSFGAVEVILRENGRTTGREALPVDGLLPWARSRSEEIGEAAEKTLDRMTRPRVSFAGVEMTEPAIMGVLNITPDSFSDGGDNFAPERAVSQGLAMWEAGAAYLDVGGESTRPGADPVPVGEELDRVLPVIEGLVAGGARVSIDTRRAEVMRRAVAAGARLVNDVTALEGDPESLQAVAEAGVPVVVMHMQGEPQTMQKNPRYDDVVAEVYEYLGARVEALEAAGLQRHDICVDPGIGFGKTVQHNIALLDGLAAFQGLGCPVMLGLSRKSFIARLSRGEAPKERLPGTLAGNLAGVARGAQILRVHDVPETLQALAIWRAAAAASATTQS